MRKEETLSLSSVILQKVEDYKLLFKFRLSLMVVMSAFVAFVFAEGGAINWIEGLLLCLGGFLVTGAANALNQVLEKDYDRLMTRTANRPLPAGRMESTEAVLAAGLTSAVGIMIFAFYFTPLSALLSTLSLVSYAFIYTPMKRVSPIAVWIGAFPGAFPMLIGYAAATGHIGVEGWILFTFQFIWQFPHFWSIGWVSYDDYAKGGFFLLPSEGGRDKSTALQCLVYALVLIPFPLLSYYVGMTGVAGTIALSLAGLFYSFFAFRLYQQCTHDAAKKLMFASFLYTPLIYVVFLLSCR